MKRKGLVLSISLVLLLALTTDNAQAQCGHYYNPLLLPFAAVGAVVGTAAAITTALVPAPPFPYPVYNGPVYYAPAPGFYRTAPHYAPAPGFYRTAPHYAPDPGFYRTAPHSSRPVGIPEHYNRFGHRGPGHQR
jgi:hypothetical protein